MSHYISLDSKSRIIAGFSDAFETPQSGDICIFDDPQQTQRQFMLNDQYNPPLVDAQGLPLYKYIKGVVKPTTADDNADLIVAQQPELIKVQLAELDNVLPRCIEDLIDAQGVDMATLPKIMQDRLKQKQDLRAQFAALTKTK